MLRGEMAPNNADLPRAIFNEVCPKGERYITNGNDLERGLPWDPPAKVIFNVLLEGVCAVHRDTERNSADIRLHVRLLCHLPRMIMIGHADYSDQIISLIYGPNYANLPYSQNSSGLPSSTQRTKPTSGSLNWSRHLFYQPYMRRYPQRCSNPQIPFPHITTRLWTSSLSCTSGPATLISIA